jgi:hypothetical protein
VPTFDVVPEPSASEASDDEDDGPADSASSSAADASTATPPRYGAPARTHLPPRPKHYVNKTVHRKH